MSSKTKTETGRVVRLVLYVNGARAETLRGADVLSVVNEGRLRGGAYSAQGAHVECKLSVTTTQYNMRMQRMTRLTLAQLNNI